ncbi:WAT1-related protein At4g30420-like [Phoenix dactylifera]|uniref:WAT1-related protein n=1 Tax=Phoenix dactylifera TaxID=42345 RepID=A0A8B8ZXW5_PHODC|nr:WAT1-related protein At4g30420-like [Phoenix dactylifera]
MGESFLEENKPGLAMMLAQCIYAVMALSAKAAFTEGMNPMVFVVYRQAMATLVVAPTTILARRGNLSQMSLGFRAFCLVFVASLVGATLNQYCYYQGLKLASSSIATAMTNLNPALTFVMAASIGLEKVKLRSFRSMAKVLGTVICVGGAMSMAFFKGPRLLNVGYQNSGQTWVIGGLLLIGSSFCWSFWLILQVPICKSYLDPLSLSAWMCLLSTFQSAILTFYLEPNLSAWKIRSIFELLCCLFAGIFGSGVTFYLQSWCISVRGPLYSAMFNPLCAIITSILAFIILNERLHIGSLIGAVAVVGGLYIVLWGKAKDFDTKSKPDVKDDSSKITISTDARYNNYEVDVKEPLLGEKPDDLESQTEKDRTSMFSFFAFKEENTCARS